MFFGEHDDGATSTVAATAGAPTPTPSAGSSPRATTSGPGPSSAAPPPGASPSPSPSSPSPSDTGPGSSTYVPELQQAAERAAAGKPAASLVALDMRNGEIVATVHAATGLSGNIAPGSTFKIVSSALLMTKGVVTPSSTAPCPASATATGRSFTNVDGIAMPNASFKEDFIRSCNTAFVALRDRVGDGELSSFSTNYFGLNSNSWNVGAPQGTTDGVVPPSSGDTDKAAQLIGQGSLKMNLMTMAPVVATAVTGTFHQPVLKRGLPVHTAPNPLSAKVTGRMREMMTACATSGTTAETFRGMPGIGAKTGTAEVGTATNGWMVAYRGHLAVAVVVEGGASGASAAGPIVRGFLSAVSPNA